GSSQQSVWVVGAVAQRGGGQGYGAGACAPVPLPVAISGIAPLPRALPILGPAGLLGLRPHQLLHHRRQQFAKQVRVCLQKLLTQPGDEVTIHTGIGHRLLSFGWVRSPKDDRWSSFLSGVKPPPGRR